jgi:opacity protein-like surface antigen
MANASVDLGTVVGITPYITGGIGAYHVDWGKTRENAFCVNGSATCSSSSPQITAVASMPDWRFAYNIGAGLSFEIAPKTVLDVNYRYSRMAGGPALKFSSADMAAGSQGAKATDHDLTRHEIRAGLRILLW